MTDLVRANLLPNNWDAIIYGGAIVIPGTKEEGKLSMEYFTMHPLNIILTQTQVPRSTEALSVAGVRAMLDKHTEVVQGMFAAMGAIARYIVFIVVPSVRLFLVSWEFQEMNNDS